MVKIDNILNMKNKPGSVTPGLFRLLFSMDMMHFRLYHIKSLNRKSYNTLAVSTTLSINTYSSAV